MRTASLDIREIARVRRAFQRLSWQTFDGT